MNTDATNDTDATRDPVTDARQRRVVRLGSPEDLLARVPYFLGFHPHESLVLLGFDRPDDRAMLRVTARSDLPQPGTSARDLRAGAAQVSTALRRNQVRSVLVLLYSADPDTAARFFPILCAEFDRAGILVREQALRADGSRWWSLTCAERSCCPAEGVPYDLAGHPAALDAIYDGQVALAGEDELCALVEPLPDRERTGMPAATAAVLRAAGNGQVRPGGTSASGRTGSEPGGELVVAGVRFVADLVRAVVAEPRRLTDEEVSWLGFYLRDLQVRDTALALIATERDDRQVGCWQDVARRAMPPYDVPALTLLGFAAWASGNGALALRAVERALAREPEYHLAVLLSRMLLHAIPPSEWIAIMSEQSQILVPAPLGADEG